MTFNLDFGSDDVQYINLINTTQDITQDKYNLIIGKVGDGEVYPYEGTQSQQAGSTVAINAIADVFNNFKFDKWVINGVSDYNSLTSVEINSYVEAIANFIKQYEVEIDTTIGGTVSPSGTTFYDIGEIVEILATPNDDIITFENWEVNNIDIGDQNPLQYEVTEDALIVAFFKGVINYIQDVFGTTPNDKQEFIDKTGKTNNVTYKNVQVGTFEGTLRMSPQLPLIPTGDVLIKIRFSTTEIGINQALVSQYISGQIGRFQLFISNTNGIRLFIGGSPNVDVTAGVIVPNTVYDVEFERFGNLYTVKLNGLLIISIESSTGILQTSSTSICSFDAGGLPLTLRGNLYYFEIEGVCEYTLQDNTGNIIYNKLGNNNHSFITNAILEDFRGTYVDNHDSGLIENGYSKYLVNTVAGTTVTLADPEGNNLSENKVFNGDFSNGTDYWIVGTGWTIENGLATTNGDTSRLSQENIVEEGKIYLIEFTKGGDGSLRLYTSVSDIVIDIYAAGEVNVSLYYTALNTGNIAFRAIGGTVASVDNVSIKEVLPIPAYGEGEISINKETASTTYYYFIKNNLEVYPNFIAYGILISAQLAVKLISINGGSVTTLVASLDNYIDLNTNYIYKWQRNETVDQYFIGATDSLRLSIKGGVYTDWTIIGTVIDNIITEMKYNECIASVGDELSHISKDSIKYDLDNFIDTTGEYDVVYVTGLNDGSSDAKGNPIEIPKNVVSNNNILFDGVQVVGIETDAIFTDIHNLENSATVEIIKDNLTVSNLKIIE